MLLLLLVIVVIALLFGGYGTRTGWGYAGWSPLGIILLIVIILALTGNLHL